MFSDISSKPIKIENVKINTNVKINNYSNNSNFSNVEPVKVETIYLEEKTIINPKYFDVQKILAKYAEDDSQIKAR